MKKVVSVWTLEICPIIYQSCYREEEIKARLLVVELFLESIFRGIEGEDEVRFRYDKVFEQYIYYLFLFVPSEVGDNTESREHSITRYSSPGIVRV